MREKKCEQCDETFKPRHNKSRFCSQRCLWDNNKKRIPANKGKGKGWLDKRGYRWNYVTENGRQVARREHRIIMEKQIGRKLEPCELIHHINGDMADNRIENLSIEKWEDHTSQHATGSRRDTESRKSMERFALMREELKRVRELNSELLEALEYVLDKCTLYGRGDAAREKAAKAIAKAYGES